jgi:ATPase subunit of ABC transporter with duplicated ATPase domains
MLSVNNITMRFGGRILFEDVTCSFMAGRRYAITGPNGAGKSTLMKILAGDFEPTKGSISRPKKLGILRQDQFAFDEFRVIDTIIMGNAPLWKALQERDALYAKPHDKLTDKDGMRLGELEGSSAKREVIRRRRMRRFCSMGSALKQRFTNGRWASCRAARKSACCWRKRFSAIRRRCCWTSRRTTWTSIPCTGCRTICTSTRAC